MEDHRYSVMTDIPYTVGDLAEILANAYYDANPECKNFIRMDLIVDLEREGSRVFAFVSDSKENLRIGQGYFGILSGVESESIDEAFNEFYIVGNEENSESLGSVVAKVFGF